MADYGLEGHALNHSFCHNVSKEMCYLTYVCGLIYLRKFFLEGLAFSFVSTCNAYILYVCIK